MDTDDFKGECDQSINFDTFSDYREKPKVRLNFPKRTEKNYPLLRTLNEAIVISLDEMAQEINLDTSNEIPNGGEDNGSQNSHNLDKTNPSKAAFCISSSFVTVSVTLFAIFLFKLF